MCRLVRRRRGRRRHLARLYGTMQRHRLHVHQLELRLSCPRSGLTYETPPPPPPAAPTPPSARCCCCCCCPPPTVLTEPLVLASVKGRRGQRCAGGSELWVHERRCRDVRVSPSHRKPTEKHQVVSLRARSCRSPPAFHIGNHIASPVKAHTRDATPT